MINPPKRLGSSGTRSHSRSRRRPARMSSKIDSNGRFETIRWSKHWPTLHSSALAFQFRVDDVEAAVAFYTGQLGRSIDARRAPACPGRLEPHPSHRR